MKIECYAASLPQNGQMVNEDAFLIMRGDIPCAALCDGAGNAEQAARRTLKFFEKLHYKARPEEISMFQTWAGWVRLMDSSLLGGPQSTFVAVAGIEGRFVGACVGDSRAYLRKSDGKISILTESAGKQRLGSGAAKPLPIHVPVQRGDLLLLMSDGAWVPLNLSRLQKVLAKCATMHPAELPSVILEEAGRTGRVDDMTVVALKVL